MAEITAAKIKELREISGAGMMDCKKALNEAGGDFEAAKDWLREKGLAKAAKKASRVAAEGVVVVAAEGNNASVIELNSETDFVAKNEDFQAVARNIAATALATQGDLDALNNATEASTGKPVSEVITDNIATIGENLNLRRVANVSVNEGAVVSYIHNAYADNIGRIAVLVALESAGDKAALEQLGKQLAMHIAAMKPESLNVDGVNAENLERERKIYAEQARASGKPENIIEKMVEGRIRKYYEQVVFLEQPFVIDGKTAVKDVLKEAEKEAGAPVSISDYAILVVGEGIEKEETDFAAEVAQTVNAA